MFISAPVLAGISVGSAILAVMFLLWLQARSDNARARDLEEREQALLARQQALLARQQAFTVGQDSVKEGVVLHAPAPVSGRDFIKHKSNVPPPPRALAASTARMRSDRQNVANTPKSESPLSSYRTRPSEPLRSHYDDSAERARRDDAGFGLFGASMFASSHADTSDSHRQHDFSPSDSCSSSDYSSSSSDSGSCSSD